MHHMIRSAMTFWTLDARKPSASGINVTGDMRCREGMWRFTCGSLKPSTSGQAGDLPTSESHEVQGGQQQPLPTHDIVARWASGPVSSRLELESCSSRGTRRRLPNRDLIDRLEGAMAAFTRMHAAVPSTLDREDSFECGAGRAASKPKLLPRCHSAAPAHRVSAAGAVYTTGVFEPVMAQHTSTRLCC